MSDRYTLEIFRAVPDEWTSEDAHADMLRALPERAVVVRSTYLEHDHSGVSAFLTVDVASDAELMGIAHCIHASGARLTHTRRH